MKEDSIETKLAQEFKDYLRIISDEISAPLRLQVDENSENVHRIKKVADKIDEDLQDDIQIIIEKNLDELNKKVVNIYSNQQKVIEHKMGEINSSLLNKIEMYEQKTTERLLAHRWIETLVIISVFAILLFFKNGYIPT